jgi:hypothetical protein
MMNKIRKYQFVYIIIFILIIFGVYVFSRPDKEIKTLELSAAIINGLSEEFPNPTFLEEANIILENGGYSVDYYNSSHVTYDLYRTLPEKNYDLIILRIHCAPMDGNNPGAAFFTSENQEGLFFTEQLLGWVRRAKTLTRGDRYYAVTPIFFIEGMKGNFNDTLVITMSCFGAVDDTLGEIFTDKGAKAFLGWDEKVTAQHMDEVIISLLEQLITEEEKMEDSVEYVINEHGVDPFYNSQLILFSRN